MIYTTFRIKFTICDTGKKVIDAVRDVVRDESVPGFIERVMYSMFNGSGWKVESWDMEKFTMIRDFNGIIPNKVKTIMANLTSLWYANHDTISTLFDIQGMTVHINGKEQSYRWEYDRFVPINQSGAKKVIVYVENNPYIKNRLSQSGLFEPYELDSVVQAILVGPENYISGEEPLCCTVTVYEGGHEFEYSREYLDL